LLVLVLVLVLLLIRLKLFSRRVFKPVNKGVFLGTEPSR
jgi:hypothetical protein